MINELKLSIENRKPLPFSLIGQVNVLKIVTLYLFQNLPANFFK